MSATYKFHLVPVSDIYVVDRDRKELKDIESLADSILRFGLLHPIVISKKGRLVAGERRLRAVQQLGQLFSEYPKIPVHFVEELDEYELKAIELEENIKRCDLTWQEECLSYKTYHEIRCSRNPEWTIEETADSLGTSHRSVSRRVMVAREILEGNELILKCQALSAAFNVLDRIRQRSIDTEMVSIQELDIDDPLQEPLTPINFLDPPIKSPPITRPASADIIQASFLEWAPLYSGPPFNTIHCDFPYGINMDKAKQGAIQSYDSYADTAELYWDLVYCLLNNKRKIISPSCHILFWFSMKHYGNTVKVFEDAGFAVNPVPLIWYKNDNVGILPDPARGPRQVYETALLMSLGDRKIIRAVSNVSSYAANKAKAKHISEKPFVVMQQFLMMLVDSSTRFLDPTCGSGTSIAAAERHGAESVTGMDLDILHVETARAALNHQRLALKGFIE